jgi:hypothetical protein
MNNALLKIVVVPLVFTSAATSAYSKEKKMNILFISVDDMNIDLGCYGHPLVKSPNIDRLASQGIAFSNAYCQFPLSSPSRSSLLTGLRPDRTRVFDLTYHFRQDLPEVINYTPTRGLGSAMAYYSDKKGIDMEHTDGKMATETIKLLQKHKDKPFFIDAGFYKLHLQELNNLADNLKYTGKVNEMKTLLKKVHPDPVEGGKAVSDTKERFSN